MGRSLFLIFVLLQVAIGAEECPKEDFLSKINALMERHYLWWDKIKDLSWKDEKELIENLRKIGDRWTSITKQEEDRLWYSSSKMVGLGIRWDDKGYVTRVFPDSPAKHNGIIEGDLIVSIQDVTDKSLWRKAIREAKKGDLIKVELIRDGFFISINVAKGEFTVPVVEDVKIIKLGDKRVGYVKVNNFTHPATEGFREAMELFKLSNVEVLVIDLRDNGGGLISVAKSMVDMLVGGDGVMFYLEGRGRNMGVYQFKNREGFNKPIVVLVNKNTASAAELTVSLLRRYARAVVVGENTVGKYVGSNLYHFDSCGGNVLRLITFEMKLPNGETITSDKGLSPDCRLGSGDPIVRSLECLSTHAVEAIPSGQP
ncbi:MAG: S41 family peptidase [Aquificaceae bacterium]|nr:S41 family peptidase [Aquificaceae bacterium]